MIGLVSLSVFPICTHHNTTLFIHRIIVHHCSFSFVISLGCLYLSKLLFCVFFDLKGHSHLWDRADMDTSFLTLKKVHLNLKSKFI